MKFQEKIFITKRIEKLNSGLKIFLKSYMQKKCQKL